METPETLQIIIKDYRRKVRLAYDDVNSARYQLAQHKEKLESMMHYQRECEKGVLSLPAGALYYAQRRECQLLLDHLVQGLAQQRDCVQSCCERVEQYEQCWRKYDEQLRLYQARLAEQKPQQEQQVEQLPNHPPVAAGDRQEPYSWIHIDRKIR